MERPLGANALAVLRRRYLARDSDGMVAETAAGLWRRVAHAVAAPDRLYGADEREVAATEERFYARMAALELLPNSPTLMNAGRPLGQLAACFVIPVEDSTEAIFEAVGWAALIQKTGGGTGFAFSRLRPAGDLVASTHGVASGPVSFMQVFDTATEAIKQGGMRRGANMGVLRVDHPDILEFITVKLDPARMRNFNLSVAMTDAFMEAAERGESYALVNPRTGLEARRLDARRVLDLIANVAWRTGDPGLLFLDRINESQPTPALGAIEATNPCGEQPLLPFESCVLASINVATMVRDAELDLAALGAAVHDGVHFLDNVIDANVYPLPQIAEHTCATRKIGLGVMGFADLLVELGIPYDAPDALAVAGRVAQCLERESLAASAALAERRGTFPAYALSRWAEQGIRLRNATTTTVAPTGTISIIAGCSSGIEPLYAVAYERHVLDGDVLVEVNPAFRRRAERDGFWSDALAAELARRGRVRGFDAVPAGVQRLFATAHDLPAAVHIEMQAAFQRHAHAAVSKTVNLPHSATPADVAAAYRLAHGRGCKGITVYRDRSRDEQVLTFGNDADRGDSSVEDDDTLATPPPARDCPVCGGTTTGPRGCVVCRNCGWSVCE